MDLARIELASSQCPDNFDGPVDLRRIELLSPQCECGALPLDHRPIKVIEDPRFINPDRLRRSWIEIGTNATYYHYTTGPKYAEYITAAPLV